MDVCNIILLGHLFSGCHVLGPCLKVSFHNPGYPQPPQGKCGSNNIPGHHQVTMDKLALVSAKLASCRAQVSTIAGNEVSHTSMIILIRVLVILLLCSRIYVTIYKFY